MAEMKHSFFAVGAGRDFVVFNDQELTEEVISEDDLEEMEIASGSEFASAAWSCGCSWYFIITDDAILLFNVYSNRGFQCRKKSAAFIEAFLNAPHLLSKPRRGARSRKPAHGMGY